MNEKTDNKKMIAIVVGIVIALLVVIAGVLIFSNSPAQRLKKQLSLGERYLSELKYDEAVLAFEEALKIEPKSEEARAGLVKTYSDWGDSFTDSKDYEKAIDIYAEGYGKINDIDLESLIIDTYILWANSFADSKDYDTAINILESGVERTGSDVLRSRIEQLKIEREKYEYDIAGEQEVVWSDEALESIIRKQIGKTAGPVKVKDLDDINTIGIYGDIDNSQNDKNISFRYVDDFGLFAYYGIEDEEYTVKGPIRDISVLKYFRNLTSVSIIANQITDISVLNEISSLKQADFWGNNISDLSPLERLKNTMDEYTYELNREQNVSIGDILPIAE